jgi:Arc/MetJ-type ribon-helix-helix transcriptional regulator
MTETIPVRMDSDTLKTLDLLVRMGLYSNRSEAVRGLMRRGLDSQRELRALGSLVEKIRELDASGALDFSGLRLERDSR